jgi:hypothetical protein
VRYNHLADGAENGEVLLVVRHGYRGFVRAQRVAFGRAANGFRTE